MDYDADLILHFGKACQPTKQNSSQMHNCCDSIRKVGADVWVGSTRGLCGFLGGEGGGISSVCYLAQLLALPTVKILSAFLCLHKQSFHSLGHGVGQFSLIRIREPRSTLGCPRLSISMEARTHQIDIGINAGVPSRDVREACPGKRTCNSMRPMQPEGQETNQVSSNFLLSSGTAC